MSKKGFTLIEVLVSISIIGIVFGIIIMSGAALQRSSRDTQRQTDLRNLQSSLQQYYADQNFFPSALNLTTSNSFTSSTGFPPSSPLPNPVKTYMNNTPIEPQTGGTPYCYYARASSTIPACDNTTAKCHYYSLCARLEAPPAGLPSSADCQTLCGSSYNYQLTPN